MSDYIPTTEEVRAAWFSHHSGLRVSAMSKIESGPYTGFDQWLDETIRQAQREATTDYGDEGTHEGTECGNCGGVWI